MKVDAKLTIEGVAAKLALYSFLRDIKKNPQKLDTIIRQSRDSLFDDTTFTIVGEVIIHEDTDNN